MKLKPLYRSILAATLVTGSLTLLPSAKLSASANVNWHPLSSEKLIRLPANYMDKSLQQNFRESDLASSINAAETQIRLETQRMQGLRESISSADGEQRIELQHQLLESKSSYLVLMQDKFALDRSALETRGRVYEQVMDRLSRDKRKGQDPVTADLMAQQSDARQRLQSSIARVDEMMVQVGGSKDSKYQQQYAVNLGKIEELKVAINRHVANESPAIDGQEVSREEYVRHILANVEAERAIMDQEGLMLTYMAKLVALDAQELEQELLDGGEGFELADKSDPIRPVNAADLFIY